MNTPFIIYALPRSRTAWLSNFLTYKDWRCYHELSMFMRSMDDVKKFFSEEDVGCAETAAMHARPLICHVAPNIKEVVVLRPLDEVINSLMKIDISGVATYNRDVLKKGLGYCDRVLRDIANDTNVLTVTFDDLHKESICKKIWNHCLPYEFDKERWNKLKNQNIQIDSKAFLGYRLKYREEITAFKRHCKLELFKLVRTGAVPLRKAA